LKIKDDLTGRVFGRLTVTSFHGILLRGERRDRQWDCLCECGNSAVVTTNTLNTGQKQSCGCLKKDLLSKRMKTHGLTGTKLYDHWMHMKQRCINPNNAKYKDYGGRGVTVCTAWLDSFEKFLEDMLPTYEPRLSLEREDVNGNYNKENCKWVILEDQALNRRKRKDNTSGATGVQFRETSYLACWMEGGKYRSKSFSIKKYGLSEAREMAILFRKAAIKRLEEIGVFYGEFHGLSPEEAMKQKHEEQE